MRRGTPGSPGRDGPGCDRAQRTRRVRGRGPRVLRALDALRRGADRVEPAGRVQRHGCHPRQGGGRVREGGPARQVDRHAARAAQPPQPHGQDGGRSASAGCSGAQLPLVRGVRHGGGLLREAGVASGCERRSNGRVARCRDAPARAERDRSGRGRCQLVQARVRCEPSRCARGPDRRDGPQIRRAREVGAGRDDAPRGYAGDRRFATLRRAGAGALSPGHGPRAPTGRSGRGWPEPSRAMRSAR
jgi:hypothetical protein